MRKSSRIAAAIATAAVASIALSSCGFSNAAAPAAESGKTTLNFLVPSYSDATKGLWQGVIAGFEKKNPKITVNLDVESWDDLNDVVTTKIQANKAPDMMNGGPFAGFVADKLLYPAKDVVSPTTLADFQPSFVDSASVKGTQYGLPLIASARTLFINNTLFKKAGLTTPPKTWADLYTDAKAISALGGGVYGYGMPLGSEEAQAEAAVWFYGGGGSFGDADKITIDTPANLAAATFMQKMTKSGATEPDAGSTDRTPLINVFVQGKIGMIVGLPPTVAQIASTNKKLDYSLAPIPTKDGTPFTLGVADHLMAFKNGGDKAKKAAITKFFDYFYQPAVYTHWVKTEKFLPTTISGGKVMAGDASLKPFLDALPSAKFYPSTNPNWSATNAAFESLVGQLAQNKKPEDVLKAIQTKSDAG